MLNIIYVDRGLSWKDMKGYLRSSGIRNCYTTKTSLRIPLTTRYIVWTIQALCSLPFIKDSESNTWRGTNKEEIGDTCGVARTSNT